jgi:hypothetical protein
MIGIIVTAALFILAGFTTGIWRILLIVFGLISAAIVAVGLGLVAGMKASGDLPAETGGKSATEKKPKTAKGVEPKKMKPEPEVIPGKAATVEPDGGEQRGAAGWWGRKASRNNEKPSRAEKKDQPTRGDKKRQAAEDAAAKKAGAGWQRPAERNAPAKKADRAAAPTGRPYEPGGARAAVLRVMPARSMAIQVSDAVKRGGAF